MPNHFSDPAALSAKLTQIWAAGNYDAYCDCINGAIHAFGVKAIVERTGISRGSLHAAFVTGRNPTLKTVWPVLKALGVRISFCVKDGEDDGQPPADAAR